MRALVLGAGYIGPLIASDMIECEDVSEVVVGDLDEGRLHKCAEKVRSDKLSMKKVDANDHDSLVKMIKGFDVVANALPPRFMVSTDKASIEAQVSIVDLTFEPEQMLLADAAQKAGVTFIPACGVAPGLGNILAGHGAEQLEKVDEIHIMCGGIPQTPIPPLFYKLVFRIEGLWGLYTDSPKVVKDGEIKVLPPLSGISREIFPEPFGEIESFYTDGLATLLYTMKGVRNMSEKTLRWPGHIERIKTLIDCGLLATKPIKVDGHETTPRKFITTLLSPVLEVEEVKDVTLMRVIISGEANGSKVKCTYEMIDYYDDDRGFTSMARTTGYPCSIACQMIARGDITAKGLVPPEKAFQGELFKKFMEELARRNVRVQETVTLTKHV